MMELLRRFNLLKDMPRTGWLLAGVPIAEVEDVSQHSFEVAAIVLAILGKTGGKLDGEKAVEMALIHDAPECLVGDFPYPGLKYLPKERKREMEARAAAELFKEDERLLELWREFAEGRSAEARLVHAADYLSILLQALKYAERGNRSEEMLRLWQQVLEDIEPYLKEFPAVAEVVEKLREDFSRLCSRQPS